jgi:predicted peptidase
MRFSAITGLVGILVFATTTHAQNVVDGFVARVHKGENGVSMPYRLFIPEPRSPVRPLPLIVYLHGGAGAGTDNLLQITGGNTAGSHLWATRDIQSRHPAFVVAPQLPGDNPWGAPNSDELTSYARLVVDLLANLSEEFTIDRDRIYLVGQSRGGVGTWDLVSKRPELFAAAVPLCGGGNRSRVVAAREVAIWAFHGAKDPTVPVAGSRELVAALKSVGGSIRYTEYPEAGHDVWTLAFAERELPEWLFAQTRPRR